MHLNQKCLPLITILVILWIMKVIFSRKGFDSTAGGIPSIKIGKNLQSLPIPYKKKHINYIQWSKFRKWSKAIV